MSLLCCAAAAVILCRNAIVDTPCLFMKPLSQRQHVFTDTCVIALIEPGCYAQVTIIGRSEEDELLLLASDGLWDVLTNQEAVNLAQRCLKRARQRGASRQAAARVAASVLTRAAVDQGSSDNVTVVVVDLSRCVYQLPACVTSREI